MKKILTAEDDKEINRLICEYLSSQGYETLSALNGLDAVRIVREQSDLSLLILDLMLPFQSGDMVLQKIRELSDIPVIVVSAKSETRSKIDLLRMGADDYITKPFDLDELLVLDEPVNGLDPEGIVEVRQLIKRMQEEWGVTVLISSHLLSELSELCTDFSIISHGNLIENLSREELLVKCKNHISLRTDDINKLCIPFEDSLSEEQIDIFHQILDCVSDTAADEMRAAYKVGFKDGVALMREVQE